MKGLSASEVGYHEDGITENVRSDSRKRLDFRKMVLEVGILPQSNGSARLALHDSSTDVLASVKAELGPRKVTENPIHIQVSVCPSVSAKVEGRAAEELDTELTQLVQRLLTSSEMCEWERLWVLPEVTGWTLYVDVRVFDDGGNIVDAIVMAIYAAISTTLLPLVNRVGIEGQKTSLQVDSDPHHGLCLTNPPLSLSVTLFKVGKHVIVDATKEEEICAQGQLTLAVDTKGQVGGFQQRGCGSLSTREMQAMIDVARTVSDDLLKALHAALEDPATLSTMGFLS